MNVLTALLALVPSQQPFVRVHDEVVRELPVAAMELASPGGAATLPMVAGCEELLLRAWHGQPGPEGGALAPLAFANPAGFAGLGRLAFVASVSGVARNQGVFVADGPSLRPLALGCGNGGGSGVPGSGCGDPTPAGGTYAGFFGGTFFAPATNARGDVLFLCDVDGGSTPRALFLYLADADAVLKVAGVGDASPAGGTLGAVGPGSLSDGGEVAFLATGASASDHQLLRWSGGALTKIARVGDPAPGGGSFTALGGESLGFVDGTSIPVGPLPDIDDAGRVAFRPVAGGVRGIALWQAGATSWYLRNGEPVPGGGTYVDFRAPSLGAAGEVAFFADFQAGGGASAGWFAGAPGAWRRVLAFLEPVGGGQCFGLAVSRNPMQSITPAGDVLVWTTVRFGDGSEEEQLVLGRPSGALETLAAEGDALPGGGALGILNAWPSIDADGRVTVSAATPGGPGLNTHFVLQRCGLAAAYCEGKPNSQGCTPRIGAFGVASATSSDPFTITAGDALTAQPGMLFYGSSAAAVPFQGGTRCVANPIVRTTPQSASGAPPPSCGGSYAYNFQARIQSGTDPTLVAGATVYAQWWTRDPQDPAGFGTGLSDALRVTIAP